ncbi:sphingosine N-acyltransferase-like protein FUM18 [Elsinoe australis]|uniref:Sphingosine N-acyltransferase-like protein FUM18 n=1 Tax=Elsinoe australis TaxID=40998 RepID=A0A4U7BAV4_9PEZI|nr:sphingosine N-acyltransferase-like protein FUM18 [Elsinoe australis]
MAAIQSPSQDTVRKDSVHAQEGYNWQTDYSNDSRRAKVLQAPTCSNPGAMASAPRKTKRKDDSLSYMIRQHIVNHQLGLSINCLALLTLTHVLFPSLRSFTTPFFTLSHQDHKTGEYHPGTDDFKFVSLWIIIFTGLRAGTMDYVLTPWARSLGLAKKKTIVRFSEQGWMLIYYCIFWSLGMYLYYTSDYFANLPAMWNQYPSSAMTGLFKFYYLAQFAFWLQQIVVVHIEDRRKDHWQMFTHHIITSLLMLMSYGWYQTKVGNVILCIMDVVDIILPAAKMMKYAGMQIACDIAFGVFIVTWFVARHIIYMAVVWSVYEQLPANLHYGCYDLNQNTRLTSDGGSDVLLNVLHAYRSGDHPVCFNNNIRLSFLGLLLALQGLTVIWFGMICRVAYGVLTGGAAEDTRSDDEGEDEEEEEVQEVKIVHKAPKEEQVGAEELRFTRRSSPPKTRKSKGRASGISIPGHSDHKELLGRIGCDKPGS